MGWVARRSTGVLVLAACALAVGAGAGYAVSRDDSPVVHACYRVDKDGTPAAQGAAAARRRRARSAARTSARWCGTSRGPAGPRGRAGRRPGPAGPAGPAGPLRPSGADCDLERRIAAAVPGLRDRPAAARRRRSATTTASSPTTRSRRRPPVDSRHHHLRRSRAPATTISSRSRRPGSVVTASLTFDTTAVLEVALLDASGYGARERGGQQPAERQHARPGGRHGLRAGARDRQRARARTRSRCDGYRGALMTLYDLPLEQLETHRCRAPEPPGLDAFWARTLDEARSLAAPAHFDAVPPGDLRRARRRRRDVQRLRRRSDPRLVPAPARGCGAARPVS